MATNVCPNCGHVWCDEHVFTQSQIKAMSLDEYEQNREEIFKQMEKGLIR